MREDNSLSILLIKPRDKAFFEGRQAPYGLLLLSSCLKQHLEFVTELTVTVIDARVGNRGVESYADEIRSADIIGISAMTSDISETVKIADYVKSCEDRKIVVVGGPWAHRASSNILNEFSSIDWVFEGEAEIGFPCAVERYYKGESLDRVPGLYRRGVDSIILGEPCNYVQNLSQLPMADWINVNWEDYREYTQNGFSTGKINAPLLTSRGCPFQCIYCHNLFGKKVRNRSIDDVMKEMTFLYNHCAVREFHIIDDYFNNSKERVLDFFHAVSNLPFSQDISFFFPNGLRGDHLDFETIDLMKKSHVKLLTIAIETTSERIQKILNKNLNVKKVLSNVRYARKVKLATKAFFMMGFPTQTLSELLKDFFYILMSPLDFVGVNTVVPQYGSPLFDFANRVGKIKMTKYKEIDYHRYDSWYEQETGIPLGLITSLTYMLFYANPLRIIGIGRVFGWKSVFTRSVFFFKFLFRIFFH